NGMNSGTIFHSRFKSLRTERSRGSGVAHASRVLGSTGCQPVVVGSPADNIFARAVRRVTPIPGLGKLPRRTGLQPVLPRITEYESDRDARCQPAQLASPSVGVLFPIVRPGSRLSSDR